MHFPFDQDGEFVSVPPVIISPFTTDVISSVPYQIAKRDLPNLWPTSNAGAGIKVAVIDTGVDTDHPEIRDTLLVAKDFTGSRRGGEDVNGHGTHVSSLVAGLRCGGAPKAKICSYKALGDQGWGRSSWVAQAVDAAIQDGVHIINMSLGSSSPSTEIYAAIKRAYQAGIIVFAATGNDGNSRNSYPADYNEVCVAVAAIDANLLKANFSNAGQGTDICDFGVRTPGAKVGGGHVAMSGTSMSTPVAASMAANRLSFEEKWSLTPPPTLELRYKEMASLCRDLGRSGRDPATGWGQIDEVRAFGTPPVAPDPIPKPKPPLPPLPPEDDNPSKVRPIGTLWKTSDGKILMNAERTGEQIIFE